jgi:hypothetical protein
MKFHGSVTILAAEFCHAIGQCVLNRPDHPPPFVNFIFLEKLLHFALIDLFFGWQWHRGTPKRPRLYRCIPVTTEHSAPEAADPRVSVFIRGKGFFSRFTGLYKSHETYLLDSSLCI